jgi:superfamily II DNA or RNA helicase
MTKQEEIQEIASNILIRNNWTGILSKSPRTGKSLTFLKSIRNTDFKILIIVPDLSVKDNWKRELIKWNCTANIILECKASLKLHKDIQYDLVCWDEIQDSSYSQICTLAYMKYKQPTLRICGLTGSLDEKSKKKLKTFLKLDVIYQYSIEQAINDGIIADYKIICIPVKLTPSEQTKYNEITAKFEDAKSKEDSNPYYKKLKVIIGGQRARLIYGFKSKICE